MNRKWIYTIPLLVTLTSNGMSQDRVDKIPDADFERLHSAIKPQRGESPWRDISWVTNITDARQRGVAEDKPLVIFTAADGSPLGRT